MLASVAALFWVLGGLCLCSITHAWQSDNGNGTYTNPVLYADYADPDIIRVGSDFYMSSTTFADSPGINVLHSKDLVNWELVGHAANNLDGGNSSNLMGGNMYRGGMWASSIRYRNGTFYIAVQPTFSKGRIYYATSPAGPWNFHQLDRGIYDPGLFFDTDGTGYVICGHGPQTVMKLNSTYSAIIQQNDNIIDSGGEGSHVVKRGSYYYLFNANPGVSPFQLRCSRATNLYGPWETGHVCLTSATGGHQGAIVDINDSDQWFGFVHQDSGAVGRMPRLGPVFWENNWPVFGTAAARDQIAASYPKPILNKPLVQPANSDDFSSATLGLQWQWNHNPDNTKWSLTERSGYLRLRPTQATGFWTARNTITQKGQGPQSSGVVKLDLTNLQSGDNVGFGTLGKVNGRIYVTEDASGNKALGMEIDNRGVGSSVAASGVPFSGNTLYLRTDLNFQTNLGSCAYSANGTTWSKLGMSFPLEFDITYSTFQGEKFAISCFNANPGSGYVDVDSFTFADSAPLAVAQRGRPRVNPEKTTFVADNGQLLRGPFTSTEWTSAAPADQIASMKNLGFNAVHLYAESFNPNYPTSGTAPGYAVAEVDKIVQRTRDAGLYLIITIGNGAYNGEFNRQFILDFWTLYATRYKNETHVIFEIQNEPFAWGPSYDNATLQMEADAYGLVRSLAPDTPILLFSYSVLGSGSLALNDIDSVKGRVLTATGTPIDWTKTAIGFHGYAGYKKVSSSLQTILAAGYPCFMTEFIGQIWGDGAHDGFDNEMTSELERLKISWLNFLYVPPSGVSTNVTTPQYFKDRVENSGLSWRPDYGTWPPARAPYGNGGLPRRTTATWTNNFLTGTLRVQAEDFDSGGQGVSYSDTDSTNNGGQYRTADGVDLEGTSDTGGGYDIGWTSAGEWSEYTIWVEEPGYYNVGVRYAATVASAVRLDFGGIDKTGTWALAPTGGSQTWATATKEVFLGPGRQKVRLNTVSGSANLNWFEIAPSTTAPVANGTYKLMNRQSGKVMEGVSSSGTVVQNPYDGSTARQWVLQHLGAGQYKIASASNNWSLNVFYTSDREPLQFVWWWSVAAQNQRFLLLPTEPGYHRIVAVQGGLSMEIADALLTDGAAARQFTYGGEAHRQWAVQALAAPSVPAGLTADFVVGSGVILNWTGVSGASSYTVKRSATPGGPYTTLSSSVSGTTFTDTTTVPGNISYYVVSAAVGGVESLNSGEVGVFPPWKWQDIGTTRLGGGMSYASGAFTVKASGADIWGTADAYHYTWMRATGDCSITARVASVQNTDPWAKAGVMIRSSLDANASNAFVAVTPGNGVCWQYRATTGGNSVNTPVSGLTAPYWLRLVRSGNTFTAYRSSDGTAWTQQGSTSISMGAAVYMGLALTSHNNGLLGSAVFDNVATNPDWLKPLTPPRPSTPSALAAMPYDSAVALAWDAVPAATQYRVKRSTAAGGPYTVVSTISRNRFTDTGLSNGTTYRYLVTALNAAGESADPPSVSATPVAGAFPPPVVRLKLDETTGTTAADSSGNGWNATLANGPTWVTGLSGNAISLDGTDDHLTLPTGFNDGLGDFTISAWVRLDAISNWARVFDFGSGSDNYLFLTPRNSITNAVRFAIRTPSSGEQIIDGTSPLPIGAWTHVAVTRSGNKGSLYVNGIAVGSSNAISLSPAQLGEISRNYIGRSQSAGDPYLDGQVDEFTIDSRALPPAEIAEAARPLHARLAFDEASGSTTADLTGHGWNGTLVNGPVRSAETRGYSIQLDGTNDHVTLPAGIVSGLTECTLSAWVKPDSASAWSRVIDFGSGTTNYLFLTPANGSTNSVRFAIRSASTGEQVINGTTSLPTGVWSHVAITLAGSTGTLYVNGKAVGTNTAMTLRPSDLGVTTANYLGRSQFSQDPYFKGGLDDFRIYVRALSAAEIVTIAIPPISAKELRAPQLVTSGGNATFTASSSVTGHTYQLQYSDTLAEGSWINSGDPRSGNGAALVFSVPVNPVHPRRFYRILVVVDR